MYQKKVGILTGVIQPVYADIRVERGLLTLEAGATFSLYDQTNTVVAGFDGDSITGNSASPAKEIRLWYHLDTTTLTPGIYYGYFSYNVTSSIDALNRLDRPGLQIEIQDYVATPASWDLSTDEGKTRFWLGDRRKDAPIWSTEEITFLLTQAAKPIRAAALGFDVAAGQESYLTLYERTQVFAVDRRMLAKELREQATRLRTVDETELSTTSGAAGSVDPCVWPIFPTTTYHDQEPAFGRPYATAGCTYNRPGVYCPCVSCTASALRQSQLNAGCL